MKPSLSPAIMYFTVKSKLEAFAFKMLQIKSYITFKILRYHGNKTSNRQ